MTTDLEILPDLDRAPSTLFASPDPTAVVVQATRIAEAIGPLIHKQNLVKRIGQSDHVFLEGWTLAGTMLGVFPITVASGPMMTADGGVYGYEATVEARTMAGAVVGRADAECTRDESNKWANAPSFQLRSMAITRASSKALRMPLGFVMKLAGYDATPAEEMEAAAARGETVTGGRGVAPGWRDINEQQRAHADLGVLIDEHGMRQWVAEWLDSKAYQRPLAKGQLNQLRKAIDREIQEKSGAGSRAAQSGSSAPEPSPAPGDQPEEGERKDIGSHIHFERHVPTPGHQSGTYAHVERAGASNPPAALASGVPDHQSDPSAVLAPPAGDGSDQTSPSPRGSGKAPGVGDPTSTPAEEGEAIAPEDFPSDGEGSAVDIGGSPSLDAPERGTTVANSADPSPVQAWCDANGQNIRIAKVHLRKSHRGEFGDLKDWRDLAELEGERAELAIRRLEDWVANAKAHEKEDG